MTPEEIQAFGITKDYHVCGEELSGDRVRGHCHITGKYRGAVHNACNLKESIYPDKVKVPVEGTTHI